MAIPTISTLLAPVPAIAEWAGLSDDPHRSGSFDWEEVKAPEEDSCAAMRRLLMREWPGIAK